MDTIDSLIEEHAALRRLVDSIGHALGRQVGVGWDDRLCGEMSKFRAAQRAFQEKLNDHEAREERLIDTLLPSRGNERSELEPVIKRAHASLHDTIALLNSLSGVCDGQHVYAVRTVTEHLCAKLEAHFTYEEQVLFPLLRRRPAAVK